MSKAVLHHPVYIHISRIFEELILVCSTSISSLEMHRIFKKRMYNANVNNVLLELTKVCIVLVSTLILFLSPTQVKVMSLYLLCSQS